MSRLSSIECIPKEPLELFKMLLKFVDAQRIIMNVATIDKEFGVNNRSVVYRGIIDDSITFVTERNSRKYENLQQDKRLSATILLPNMPAIVNKDCNIEQKYEATWQVRLFDAQAIELSKAQLTKLWQEEPFYAKVRSHISHCGKPQNREEYQKLHDKLIDAACNNELKQTDTFTAFKIIPRIWDFYMAEENAIPDRVHFVKENNEIEQTWRIYHVDP